MNVILITSHIYNSRRKAGFHWIAEELVKQNNNVLFFTGVSLIDQIKRDYRVATMEKQGKNTVFNNSELVSSFFYYNLFRPIDFRSKLLNFLSYPLFKLYGRGLQAKNIPAELAIRIKEADLIIFESVNELVLLREFKAINSKARYVYRVSDDMSIRNTHPYVIDFEEENSGLFDLISVPTASIYDRFVNQKKLKLQYHGLPIDLYEVVSKSPYISETINAVFVGSNFLDHEFISVSAREFTEVNFHIIGPVEFRLDLENVFFYGEMNYEDTLPFIKHADFALSPMLKGTFSDSNKIIQYTYCKLPIVISSLNVCERKNFIYYTIGDKESIIESVEKAINFKADDSTFPEVRSWSQLVSDIIN